ncbi:MAG TPA: alpha/beta hydrolase [Rhodanobacteraceae bacterium]|nr:alpha/beta hydrolase [Rhodanobacteraceae bacterium]
MGVPEDESVLMREAQPPDRVVAYGSHPDQVADVRFGDERSRDRPLVLIFHGGFWRPRYDRAHTGPMAAAIADAGWIVASVEYRRVPGDPDATLDDASAALALLPASIEGHDGRVVLIGHSAGGHLVLWLASARATPELAGVLALAPAADLRLAHAMDLGDGAVLAFLGADPAARSDADPRRLRSASIPVTIVQGDRDEIVPGAVAASYAHAHRATQLTRVNAGHYGPIDPLSPVWPAVLAELKELSRTR